MQLPRRRREDFEESRVYTYPQHLRAAIEDAPTGAGVYVFHGDSGDLPLYIGKSVNIRARLLSHLRNPDEARMLRQTQRITHIRTAGEIGALLLEAQMIKQQHPLFNQKLRRNRQLCSLQLESDVPQVVYSKDMDFGAAPELYGLFASRHAALQALRSLADQHRLCYGALGLVSLTPAGSAGLGVAMPFGPEPLRFVLMMLAVGLLASWVGTLCWNAASQRLPTTLLGQLIVFETLAALGYAMLLRGRWPDAATLAGIVLLVAGVLLALRVRPRR